MTAEPDWKMRLRSERDELTARLGKLVEFLDHPEAPESVSHDILMLLHKQRRAMSEYLDVLNKRIGL